MAARPIATARSTTATLFPESFAATKLADAVNWARKYSFFTYPFVTACCGMEYFSVAGPRYDIDRFGAALPRFTPRQADLLFVVGTITQRQAPILRRVYEQMAEPKWVVSFGACTSSGGPYDNYAVLQGIDRIVPGASVYSRMSAAARSGDRRLDQVAGSRAERTSGQAVAGPATSRQRTQT